MDSATNILLTDPGDTTCSSIVQKANRQCIYLDPVPVTEYFDKWLKIKRFDPGNIGLDSGLNMWDKPNQRRVSHTQIKRQMLFLGILLSTSFILSSTLFWIFEQGQDHVNNIGDVAWWWFVTSSTVGYGDIVPYTTPGRIAGVIAIVVGLFGYTHIIGIILQVVQQEFEREERGYGTIDHADHVAICEYTAFADELIREIKEKKLFKDKDIVLIGSLVERTPYPEYDFIYGVPISPQVQQRANIGEASVIFVFSNIRFSDPDTKTLHVVSRIMERNKKAPIFVELENENHPLLQELPRTVNVIKSSELLYNALRHNYLNITEHLNSNYK